MTDPEEADRRVEKLERELAQAQAEAAYRQIAANLVRQHLKDTLDIAMRAVHRFSAGFDASIERMADDLNGRGER
jgi:hypothetical protein